MQYLAALSATQKGDGETRKAPSTQNPRHNIVSSAGISSALLNNRTSVGPRARHSHPSGNGDRTIINSLLSGVGDVKDEPTKCKGKSDCPAIGQAVLDTFITVTNQCFQGFTVAASVHSGEPTIMTKILSACTAARSQLLRLWWYGELIDKWCVKFEAAEKVKSTFVRLLNIKSRLVRLTR